MTGDSNSLLSDGTWTYTCDAEGQQVKKSQGVNAETWEYGYDHRGQMAWAEQRASDGGPLLSRVEYGYDAFGNRLRRVEYNAALAVVSDERYGYDGWDTAKPAAVGTEDFDVYVDLDAAGSVTARRVFGPGFDAPAAHLGASGAVAWYLADRQGSVRLVADNAGSVVGTRDYSAFGAIAAASGAGLERYAYTGREWDAALGLSYTRARMYDPETGRWTSEDPVGFSAGDSNLFRYVGNAVTLHTDPSGLEEPGLWQSFTTNFSRGLDRVGNGLEAFGNNLGRQAEGYWNGAQADGRQLADLPGRAIQEFRNDPVTAIWDRTGPGALYNLTQQTTRNIQDLPTNLGHIQRAAEADPNWLGGQVGYQVHKLFGEALGGKALYEGGGGTKRSPGAGAADDAPRASPIRRRTRRAGRRGRRRTSRPRRPARGRRWPTSRGRPSPARETATPRTPRGRRRTPTTPRRRRGRRRTRTRRTATA